MFIIPIEMLSTLNILNILNSTQPVQDAHPGLSLTTRIGSARHKMLKMLKMLKNSVVQGDTHIGNARKRRVKRTLNNREHCLVRLPGKTQPLPKRGAIGFWPYLRGRVSRGTLEQAESWIQDYLEQKEDLNVF